MAKDEKAPAAAAEVKVSKVPAFMNVHATTLMLDNGLLFLPGKVMRLTPAEIERFKRAEASTHERFIHLHPGPAENDGGAQ